MPKKVLTHRSGVGKISDNLRRLRRTEYANYYGYGTRSVPATMDGRNE